MERRTHFLELMIALLFTVMLVTMSSLDEWVGYLTARPQARVIII